MRGSLQVCCSAGRKNDEVQVEIAIFRVTNPLPGSLPVGAEPHTEEARVRDHEELLVLTEHS